MAYTIRTNIDPSNTSGTELADIVEEVGDLTQIVVESDTSNQPGGPSEGDAYIANGDASWVNGSQYDVAVFRDSTWIYHTPEEGWVAYIKDRGELYQFDGSTWSTMANRSRLLVEVDVAGGSNVTLDESDYRTGMVRLTGTLTADIDVIVPDTARHYVFINATSGIFTVTVRTSGGSGVQVKKSHNEWLYSDGTNVVPVVSRGFLPVDPESVTDTGTDAYTVNTGRTLTPGETYLVKFSSENTTNIPTLNDNSQGAKSIVNVAGNAWAGMIEAREHRLHYDGTKYVLLDPGGYVRAVESTDSLTFHESSDQSVGTNSYATIFDIASPGSLIGGSIFSEIPGFRLTVDGTVIADRTDSVFGNVGNNGAALGVIHVPPAKAASSMKLEAYNASGGSRSMGWRVYTR